MSQREGITRPRDILGRSGSQIALEVQVPPAAIAHALLLPTSAIAHAPPLPTPAVAHSPSQGNNAYLHHSNKGKDWALPPSEVDIHANPRYPSQLPPVFTQHYAEQEQQLKAAEHQAAKQRDLEHHMKNTVEAYGWSKDGADVTMCEFQDGITLPQFKVTARVLQALGLYSGNDEEVQVQYFNASKSQWCCHIPYIHASHPKFRMSDPIRSDPQIHTGSVTISFFIHILFI
ncbi:hypothetical protein BD769DRAFT_1669807 [Suillus cothurnatus]|nr:hypothetical protein BD769DRAFT_1669807 [Suillus cothurnatus]